MTDTWIKSLERTRIVPLVQSDNPKTALKISEALLKGGLNVLEIVLRSDAAIDCLDAIIKEFPEAHIGAGTVLCATQTKEVVARGVEFIVSPGLDKASIDIAQKADILILPGIATATELQQAYNLGLSTVKFFPADLAGGPKMLKAFSSVFRDISFMPTGGVNVRNLKEYLDVPAVLACGGSWLTSEAAIQEQNFKIIEDLSKQALDIAMGER